MWICAQAAWISIHKYKLNFRDLKKPTNSFITACNFKCALFKHNYSWFSKNKLFVRSNQTSKECIYIRQFIFAESTLKEPFQKQMYSAKRKQQKHPVFLSSSAILIANTNIIYFQTMFFLFLCSAFWGYIGQTSLVSKSSIHVGDVNLDVFSSLFVLGKAIAKPLSSYRSHM